MVKSPKSDKIPDFKLPTLKELLKAGVHFGHQARRWHPSMVHYIYATKKGIHIFDLVITLKKLEEAALFLYTVASQGGDIIFLGTKRQARELIADLANGCGAMYVNERWLGGTITNFDSIRFNMDKLKRLEKDFAENAYKDFTKKEVYKIRREQQRLERFVGGIKNLRKLPDALFIVDSRREKTAVSEAHKKNIPIVALVDSNCNPKYIDYVIPGNDDATASIKILLTAVSEAIRLGYEKAGRELKPPEVTVPVGKKVIIEAEKIKEEPKRQIKETISSLNLSNRSLNALTKAKITTIDRLVELSYEQLKKIKGLGKKSLDEITEKIARDKIKYLKRKLAALKIEKKQVLLKRGEAAAEGDLRENAAYLAADEELKTVEARIKTLKEELKSL